MPYAIHTMPPLEVFTPQVAGGIIYLGLGSAGMGYMILVRGLKRAGTYYFCHVFEFLPVTATIFGWLFLGETIGLLQIAGGIIVILSSCIVIKEKGKMEERLDGGGKLNLTMLTDFYEITMANGYFSSGMADDTAYFDMFFRKIPDGGGYAVMAGIEQVIEYLENLKFTEEDIAYLREKKIFSEDFLKYLADFKFTCDVWAVPEGTPIFPGSRLLYY